jgi:hypothetical protein
METTVTKESMEALIDSIAYHHEDNKATICFIKLKSGFIIIGTSGVVDKSTFDSKIGEHFAYQNAFNKLWEFEGYSGNFMINHKHFIFNIL